MKARPNRTINADRKSGTPYVSLIFLMVTVNVAFNKTV